jgi:3-phenylpropionate/cinnamic acid dioxygenase small subunit
MMADERIERECTQFLYREATLLDRRQLHDWLKLISADIDYRVPVRTTRERKDGDGFSTRAFFLEEDYGSLTLRIAKLDSDFAWAENPPTRTRRLVTNIQVEQAAAGAQAQEYNVVSNLALYCFRGESATPIVLTGERRDVLQRVNGEWQLKKRLVLLDTTVLGLESLSMFL